MDPRIGVVEKLNLMGIGRSIGQLAAMHDRLLAICAESVDWIDPEALLQKDYG